MSQSLKLFNLQGSPNNTKVRLALAYKKIPYEKINIDPMDRAAVVKASGQPLTPVLLHGDTIIFDSWAITRYLDANFKSGPRLYSADRETIKKIEEWETFARTEAGAPVGRVFSQYFAKEKDEAKLREANRLHNQAAVRVEAALANGSHLVGEAPTAADFAVAPMLAFGVLSETAAKAHPILAFFHASLKLEGAPRTRAWIERIMALDR